jgi:hypothetical protein
MLVLVRTRHECRWIFATQLQARQIKVRNPGHGFLNRAPRVILSWVDDLELTPFRSVERPTWPGRVKRSKGFNELCLLKQQATFRVFDGYSEPLLLLVDGNFPSKLVLSHGGFVELALTNHAHLGTRSSTMNDFGPQTVHEEPGTIALVLPRFQAPAPLVSDGILVKAF